MIQSFPDCPTSSCKRKNVCVVCKVVSVGSNKPLFQRNIWLSPALTFPYDTIITALKALFGNDKVITFEISEV